MAEAKSTDKKNKAPADEVKAGGGEEVQERMDEELAQGFAGVEVDPIPNKEYSLESGPDSPTVADAREALTKREVENNPGRRS